MGPWLRKTLRSWDSRVDMGKRVSSLVALAEGNLSQGWCDLENERGEEKGHLASEQDMSRLSGPSQEILLLS